MPGRPVDGKATREGKCPNVKCEKPIAVGDDVVLLLCETEIAGKTEDVIVAEYCSRHCFATAIADAEKLEAQGKIREEDREGEGGKSVSHIDEGGKPIDRSIPLPRHAQVGVDENPSNPDRRS